MKKLLLAFVLSLAFVGTLNHVTAQDPIPPCWPCPPTTGN